MPLVCHHILQISLLVCPWFVTIYSTSACWYTPRLLAYIPHQLVGMPPLVSIYSTSACWYAPGFLAYILHQLVGMPLVCHHIFCTTLQHTFLIQPGRVQLSSCHFDIHRQPLWTLLTCYQEESYLSCVQTTLGPHCSPKITTKSRWTCK